MDAEDGDYRVTALRDFADDDAVELAFYTSDGGVYLLNLKNGIKGERLSDVVEGLPSAGEREAVDGEISAYTATGEGFASDDITVPTVIERVDAAAGKETDAAVEEESNALDSAVTEETQGDFEVASDDEETIDSQKAEINDEAEEVSKEETPDLGSKGTEEDEVDAEAQSGEAAEGEDHWMAAVSARIYQATIDLSALKAPYSLKALMDGAEKPAGDDRISLQEGMEASEIEEVAERADSVEQAEELAAFDLADNSAVENWIIDYDSTILFVEFDGNDYYITPGENFNTATVIVHAGDTYVLNLLGQGRVAEGPATITAADGGVLPEGATVEVDVVTDENEISNLRDMIRGAQRIEPALSVKGRMGMPKLSSKNLNSVSALDAQAVDNARQAEGTTSETKYRVFDISLENAEGYEGAFHVNVELDEPVTGHDFHLYHIHDGVATDIKLDQTEGTIYTLSFDTPNFSQFVFEYTVDFTYTDVEGKAYTYQLKGGTQITLINLMDAVGVLEDLGLTRDSFVNSDARFSDDMPEGLVDLAPVYGEDGATVVDWTLTSLAPFTTEHKLLVTLEDGTEIVVGVTDDVYSGTTGNGDGALYTYDSETHTLHISVNSSNNSGKTVKTNFWNAASFAREDIQAVKIEEGVTAIDAFAFDGCANLASVDFPPSLESIGGCGFRNTGIKSLDLSACSGFNALNWNAFDGCAALETVNLKGTALKEPGGTIFHNCTALKTALLPETLTSISGTMFQGCGQLAQVNFTELVNLESVGSVAFDACASLTSADLSNSKLTKFDGWGTFRDCANLEWVRVPNTLERCSDSCIFQNCAKLKEVDLSETKVTVIGGSMFSGCAELEKVKLPATVTKICSNAFYNLAKLADINFSDLANLETIEAAAFHGCSALTRLDLADTKLKNITGWGVFQDCKNIEYVSLPSTLEDVSKASSLFSGCTKLTTVDMSQTSVTSLGSSMFAGIKTLKTVKLPATVTKIGDSVFNNCEALSEINLSELTALTSIGGTAFQGCKALTELDLSKTALVDIGSSGWGAFANCSALKTVLLPDSVEIIGAQAFSGCAVLETLDISTLTNLRKILANAFSGCDKIDFDLSNCKALEVIGDAAFRNARSMKDLDLSGCTNLISIGKEAFYGFPERGMDMSIESADLSGCTALTAIGENAFSGQRVMTSVDFSGDGALTTIGPKAFVNCSNLTSVDLTGCDNLTTIGANAFAATALEQVTIPKGVTSIASNAFAQKENNSRSITSIQTVYWDAENYTGTPSAGWFNGSNGYDLTIGRDVQSLPSGFFGEIAHYSAVYFEGVNAHLTLTAEAMAGAPGPLGGISGECYVDSKGVVYLLNGDGTATLGYCPPGIGSYTVPETVNGHRVTAVGDRAFELAKSLTSVTFENPEQITRIGSAAFAGLTALTSVNGSGLLSEVLSKTEDKYGQPVNRNNWVFPQGADIATNAFANSGIRDDVTKHPWDNSRAIAALEGDLVVKVRQDPANGPWQDADGKYTLLTGENLTLNLSTDKNDSVSEASYALVYLGFSGSDYSDLDSIHAVDTQDNPIADIMVLDTADANIKCLLVKVYAGQTANSDFIFQYPSGSAGGEVRIWNVQSADPRMKDLVVSLLGDEFDEALAEKLNDMDEDALRQALIGVVEALDAEVRGKLVDDALKSMSVEALSSLVERAMNNPDIDSNNEMLEKLAALVELSPEVGAETIRAAVTSRAMSANYARSVLTALEISDAGILENGIGPLVSGDALKAIITAGVDGDRTAAYALLRDRAFNGVESLGQVGDANDYVIDAVWSTEARERTAVKAANTTSVEITGDGTGAYALLGENRWEVSLNLTGADKNGVGADYVYRATYTDTLQLDAPFELAAEVKEAIENGAWRRTAQMTSGNGTVYSFRMSDGRVMFTLTMPEGVAIRSADLSVDDQGRPVIRWVVQNDGTAELSANKMYIGFANGVVVAPVDAINIDGEQTVYTFKNNFDALADYQHSGQKSYHAEGTMEAVAKQAELTLDKTRPGGTDYTTLLGNDITFTLTAQNIGVPTTTDANYIEDVMRETDNQAEYITIKPENMERMFSEAYGDRLTVTISNASLTEEANVSGSAVDVTGYAVVLDNDNSGRSYAYSTGHTITVRKADGGYAIALDDGAEQKYASIAGGFDAIGYRVTSHDYFGVRWDFSAAGEPFQFYGGLKVELPIYATLKDTFHMLTGDEPNHYDHNGGWSRPLTNVATMGVRDGETIEADIAPYKVNYEVALSKRINGRADAEALESGMQGVNSATNYNNGDVVGYAVTVNNSGVALSNMPLVDEITGAQYLLAPVSGNVGLAGRGLEEISVGETGYYVLKAGHYEKVWLGQSNERSFMADSIDVAEGENRKTTVKWYFYAIPRAGTGEVRYYTKIDTQGITPNENEAYDFYNRVYLNDRWNDNGHDSDRLYAEIVRDSGGGYSAAQYNVNKQIVTAYPNWDGAHEGSEQVDPDGLTNLTFKNNRAVYKITLSSGRNAEDIRIYWNRLVDTLPLTYGLFDWHKGEGTGGVKLYFREKDGGKTDLNGDLDPARDWEIVKDPEDGRFTLRWDGTEEDYILFKESSEAYIYVALQFPTDPDLWHEYCNKIRGRLLRNRVEYGDRNATVYHNAVDKGEVTLQKGVENIYQMGLTASREYYGNVYGYVEYYVTLYNGGNSRFYLNDLVDTLPKGFTYLNLRSTSGGSTVSTAPNTSTTTSKTGTVALVEDGTNDVRFVAANVQAAASDPVNGVQTVIFSFKNSAKSDDGSKGYTGSVHFDSYVEDGWFLLPGEAIAFSYTVKVDGNASQTLDKTTNRVSMDYYDPEGCGVELYEGADFAIHAAPSAVGAGYNDGDCRLGNSDTGTARQLSSEVTVRRGHVLPGITKNVTHYYQNSAEADIKNGAAIRASSYTRLSWKTTMYSEGDRGMAGYIVRDIMDSHFYFGHYGSAAEFYPVYYRVYRGNTLAARVERADSSEEAPLFSVRYDPASDQYIVKKSYDNKTVAIKANGSSANIELPAIWMEGTGKVVYAKDNPIIVWLQFHKDANGNHIMQIRFYDTTQYTALKQDIFPLMPGYRAELTYDTMAGTTLSTKTYNNVAQLIPTGTDLDYTPGNVTYGNCMYNGSNNAGVESKGYVSLVGMFATSSEKFVTETAWETNTGRSRAADYDGAVNTITLPDATSDFYYTLEVQYLGEMGVDRMVVIDNLPQAGDKFTLQSSGGERRSQFKVLFADDPNVQVYKKGSGSAEYTVIDPSKVHISYSAQTSFTTADAAWTDPVASGWSADCSSAMRSLRVWIDEGVLENNDTLHITFHAKVDNPANVSLRGKVANNSFAYHYTVGGITLEAATDLVGVRVPDYPGIVKVLENYNSGEALAAQDTKFVFRVYQCDEETNDIVQERFHDFDVTVKRNKSKSDATSLYFYDEDRWVWETGKRYAIVEWPDESTADYSFSRWIVTAGGAGNAEQRELTLADADGVETRLSALVFTYDGGMTQTFTAENVNSRWNVDLLKVDATSVGRTLPGAVFARYIPEGSSTGLYGTVKSNAKDVTARYRNQVDSQITVEAQNWMLLDIVENASDGKLGWDGILGDEFLLREVKAPDGYNLLNEDIRVSRNDADVNSNTLKLSIPNTPGYQLPSTGGLGTSLHTVTGLSMILIAIALILRKSRQY